MRYELAQGGGRLLRYVVAVFHDWQHRKALQREFQALGADGDRVLHDCGISRSEFLSPWTTTFCRRICLSLQCCRWASTRWRSRRSIPNGAAISREHACPAVTACAAETICRQSVLRPATAAIALTATASAKLLRAGWLPDRSRGLWLRRGFALLFDAGQTDRRKSFL